MTQIDERNTEFVFRHDFFADAVAAAAHAHLVRAVFDFEPVRAEAEDPAWMPFALFDPAGACVAAVEAAVLAMILDGTETRVTAIRLVGVAASYRGRGLFRDVMQHALTWCEAQAAGPTLLYTEEHALYTRFGFDPLAQHTFGGTAPVAQRGQPAEIVSVAQAGSLLDRLLPARAPLSTRCAILRASDLVRASLEADADLTLAYARDLDALIVLAIEDDTLVLADIIAERIPSLTEIVGVIAPRPARVRTMFPPDRLSWHGAPERDETGLMIRGPLPAAMGRPFMLPPTMSF